MKCRNGHERSEGNLYRYETKAGKVYEYCRQCRAEGNMARRKWLRDYQLNYRYGLTRKQRSDILVSQDGLCAICYDRFATTVDHDHKTGEVRGMLCRGCNTALGVIGDDLEAVDALRSYLSERVVA